MNFLLDTGCCRTVIDRKVLTEAELAQIDQSKKFKVMTAIGGKADILGQLRVKIYFDKQACYQNVLVSASLVKTYLLGMDILSTCPLTKSAIETLHYAVAQSSNRIQGANDIQKVDKENMLVCALVELDPDEDEELAEASADSNHERAEMRKRVQARLK